MEEKIVGKCFKCTADVVKKEKYYVFKTEKWLKTKKIENGKLKVVILLCLRILSKDLTKIN
jgi:hypothetical protein